ncbi:Histidine kinase-, DNA gyrase B-, and HSP90-like ATPase [Paraburkholderia steynii]|uniref:Histidine kinase-, DNA gyrase B-, and HSP90-like ATPase n=1 Tax=Paraburkholderia steynii TaxID=1245441 RepID=A0A7Z7BLR9_9BURK|nr:ATP-binding protein [Paraburkholderia steynii]SDJ54608.1 Histidine kinase-, DNA gyrase B-, and HSP90-like ATPase [Paraburkholderia steynii]
MTAAAATSNAAFTAEDQRLADQVRKSLGADNVVETILKTDERVIARVTDGIYRQPGSALRELISNAYDADATEVRVRTDAPAFSRISVEDNGHGMTPEALSHLIHHIGGSAKRSGFGGKLGVTAEDDPLCSPAGRRLIGKIGIGLFSVSQLTRSFQIITKVKGDDFRTVATVVLRQYSEIETTGGGGEDKLFESGRVNIWREHALDNETHGTTIVLTGIRPQARDTLRSKEIWSVVEENERQEETERRDDIRPPKYHIGRIDKDQPDHLKPLGEYEDVDNLPWEPEDLPEVAFQKLVDAVWGEVNAKNPNPRLEEIFDYYLRMVWQLSLSIPAQAVDGNLFDLSMAEHCNLFKLSNKRRTAPEPIELRAGESMRDKLDLEADASAGMPFDVYFDGLRLRRPLKYVGLPTTQHALKRPLVFVGKCDERFSKVPVELSGGPLRFEAYLFWNPKIAPTEHRGSLIRIHGASGTLFDPTFMRYMISEQTRLSQITCEIFVQEGLDSALNIDRESFNFAHPHSVFITKWLHNALRQLASTQKRLASEIRNRSREQERASSVGDIRQIVEDTWRSETDDVAAAPPDVAFTDQFALETATRDSAETYVFPKRVVASAEVAQRNRQAQELLEEKMKGIAQILIGFGVFENLSQPKQERLLAAIFKVISEESH